MREKFSKSSPKRKWVLVVHMEGDQTAFNKAVKEFEDVTSEVGRTDDGITLYGVQFFESEQEWLEFVYGGGDD